MEKSFDLLVLGAGPAGASAAIEARRHGLSVAVVDESQKAGGQIYRAPTFSVTDEDTQLGVDLRNGERLRADLDASGAELFLGHAVWHVTPSPRLAAASPEGSQWLSANALVIATGTSERVIPIPGVTLPGVIGLAAATILLKAHATLPSGPTVVAGVGPLIYAVAAGILRSGGQLAAVVDLARPAEWLSATPALLSRPDLLRRGFGWMLKLRQSGVPIRFGHTVTRFHGSDMVEAVEIKPVDAGWRPRQDRPCETFAVRSATIGHGLTPATEVARAIGVPHRYEGARGGWIPEVREDRSTALNGIYIAGDCAGISGAAAAACAGSLAGLAAARDLKAIADARYRDLAMPALRGLRRAERFGWAISGMMAPRPGLSAAMPPETVVCRCEDVTCGALSEAAKGLRHVNQLKSTTRCGMGPCQGRMCGEAAAELLALTAGLSREAVGQWTARPPLRSVPMTCLLGEYAYEDIPKPAPVAA
jgi:thioredoxin reductase